MNDVFANSAEILDYIDTIAATASKNEKEALVKNGVASAEFCRVLDYAYNPFKRYGIRKIPAYTEDHATKEFDEQTWIILDALIDRELTGTAASDALAGELHRLSSKSAELLIRIIRKDLRAGFSESTCNKAKKGLIPDFPYMRCSLPKDAKLHEWAWEQGVISQEKADGMYASLSIRDDGEVELLSRQGSSFPLEKFQALVDEARRRLTAGTQQHGEILVVRDGVTLDREIGNGVLNSVLNGGDFEPNEHPIYLIWDQIPLSKAVTKGKVETHYRDRLKGLLLQLSSAPGAYINVIPTRIVKSLDEAYKHAVELMKEGKEGTVIKSPYGIWKDGTSKEQIKIKLEFDIDLKVVAIVPGREGTRNEGRAGSLTVETSDGLLRTDVAIKNEAMRDDVDANSNSWLDKIVTLVANDIMEPSNSNPIHSLFLPRLKEAAYRLDKVVADSLARVIAAKEAAILGKKLVEEA